ncbi:MAG TPA: ABC transporter permease [Bacilli bacterium]|jgi:hypothetical protein|nr:ABC transporter permease [Bacilli bacterium]
MIVFKTILKILNKLKGMLILYTVMLILITVLTQTSDNNLAKFEESKPDILIINKDEQSDLTNNFVKYLAKHANLADIDIKDEEKINDALFYRDVNYVIYIPKNFTNDILQGKKPIMNYKSTNDESASYSQMLVNKYIKTALIYKDYYQANDLIKKINETLSTNTNVKIKTHLDTSKVSAATRYFNFLNYAFLAGCVYCISMILASLKEGNVNRRTIISSYSLRKYNRIVLLSNACVIFLMWLFYMILSFILFKKLMVSFNGILYMINSLVFAFCGLTIGFLIGNITQNKNAIGGIVNVVALGSSFLCGCFVPISYLPNYVLKIAKILPSYYFVTNNELTKSIEIFSWSNIKPLFINNIVIICFGILFIVITNFINKKKQIIN